MIGRIGAPGAGAERSLRAVALVALPLLAAGCGGIEEVVMEPFRGETPHERYVEHLERADLAETALARDWTRAAHEALEAPVEALPPMMESGWLPREAPTALGYRVQVRRGQQLRVRVDLEEDEDTRVFLEVFRVRGDPDDEDPVLLTVAWSDALERELVYDARATATFLVRVQPELLRGGPYRLSLEVGPSLAFPVDGGREEDIGSFFGAPRDGGARDHHGLDIFAPRGTPVVAASAGRVRRVRTTPIGGHVVWVRSEPGGHSEYYAHLDSQLVEDGQRVEPGDTLGLVGNSGNAITTPPHLHFGIYSRGPVDPLPFLARPRRSAAPLAVATELFSTRARLAEGSAAVHAGPSEETERLVENQPYLPVDILGASGEWARVRLPDGRHGFVHHEVVEPAEEPIDSHRPVVAALLRRSPHADAPGFRSLEPDAEVEVLARFGEWAWVRAGDDAPGWIRLAPEHPASMAEAGGEGGVGESP